MSPLPEAANRNDAQNCPESAWSWSTCLQGPLQLPHIKNTMEMIYHIIPRQEAWETVPASSGAEYPLAAIRSVASPAASPASCTPCIGIYLNWPRRGRASFQTVYKDVTGSTRCRSATILRKACSLETILEVTV